MAKQLFGTDGIRGIPGEYPLDDQTLYWVGRSIGGYLRLRNQQPRVLIGTDTRESGAHIASEIAAGLAEEGARNSFAGVITTPGVACRPQIPLCAPGRLHQAWRFPLRTTPTTTME